MEGMGRGMREGMRGENGQGMRDWDREGIRGHNGQWDADERLGERE